MPNTATVIFISWNSPKVSLLLLLFKSNSAVFTFAFENSLPLQPILTFSNHSHTHLPPALSFLILTLLCSLHKKAHFFCLFRAAPVAYGGSQAKGQIRAAAADLRHSHSNAGSKPRLKPIPQLMAMWIPNPRIVAKDQTHILMNTSWICFHCTTMGIPKGHFFTLISRVPSWPKFSSWAFLQFSYSLVGDTDIARYCFSYSLMFQNHIHHPEAMGCFILSQMKSGDMVMWF